MKLLTGLIYLVLIIATFKLSSYLKRYPKDKVLIFIVRPFLLFVGSYFIFEIYVRWGMPLEAMNIVVPLLFAVSISIGVAGYFLARSIERIMNGEVILGINKEKLQALDNKAIQKMKRRK